jgi:type VI protein secretion system component VasF
MKTNKTPLERKVDICKALCEAMEQQRKMESAHDQREIVDAIIKIIEMYHERIEKNGYKND